LRLFSEPENRGFALLGISAVFLVDPSVDDFAELASKVSGASRSGIVLLEVVMDEAIQRPAGLRHR
jgi:hypothetical protein